MKDSRFTNYTITMNLTTTNLFIVALTVIFRYSDTTISIYYTVYCVHTVNTLYV